MEISLKRNLASSSMQLQWLGYYMLKNGRTKKTPTKEEWQYIEYAELATRTAKIRVQDERKIWEEWGFFGII